MSFLCRFLGIGSPIIGGFIVVYGALVITDITAQLATMASGFAVLSLSTLRLFEVCRMR